MQVDLAAPDFDAAALAGQADILINCAGLQFVSPVHEFPPEKFRLLLAVMLEAPFLLIRAALPHMYEQGFGRIVNISSVHGLRASEFKSAYVAAKHGLEGLSKVAALEGAPHGVTSNCVSPTCAPRSSRSRSPPGAAARHPGRSGERCDARRNSAIKRLAEPSEVAELVAFLCGEWTSFANGSVLGPRRRLDRPLTGTPSRPTPIGQACFRACSVICLASSMTRRAPSAAAYRTVNSLISH